MHLQSTYTPVLIEGALYHHLPYGFHHERNRNTGEFVPLRDRRPCVRYNLCRLVVEDSVALLFSEGHFPQAECEDLTVKLAAALGAINTPKGTPSIRM